MHLAGQLSNPSGPLEAVFNALLSESLRPATRFEPQPEAGLLGNGVVQRAAVRVLASAD
jgi:hypothetical protein